ncbi:MAG: hypothetical protein ACOCUL_03625 [Bacteroidota bacterium]
MKTVIKNIKHLLLNDARIKVDNSGFWEFRYHPKKSLEKTARLFDKKKGKIIIEIGSGVQGQMSGNSILVWAKKTKAEKIIAIDLEQKHIDDVKKMCHKYTNVEALLTDGIEFVRKFDSKIDLLYLDFWTEDKVDEYFGEGRAKAYFNAYLAAKNKFSEQAMILIDDTDHVDPWKQTLIVPQARKDGFKVKWIGRQTLLVR